MGSRQFDLYETLHPEIPFGPFAFTLDNHRSSFNQELGFWRKSARGMSKSKNWIEPNDSFFLARSEADRVKLIAETADHYLKDYGLFSAPIDSLKRITNNNGFLRRFRDRFLEGRISFDKYVEYQKKAFSLATRKNHEGQTCQTMNRFTNTGLALWTGGFNRLFVLDCESWESFQRAIDLCWPHIEHAAAFVNGARRGGHIYFNTDIDHFRFRDPRLKWEIICSSNSYVAAPPSISQPGLQRGNTDDPLGNICYQYYQIYRPTPEEFASLPKIDPEVIVRTMLQMPLVYSFAEPAPLPKPALPKPNEETSAFYDKSPDEICRSCLPKGHGERNAKIFQAARLLKSACPDAPLEEMLDVFRDHFVKPCLKLNLTSTTKLKTFESDFKTAWKNAYGNSGQFLPDAEAKSKLVETLLDQQIDGLSEAERKALAFCVTIQLANGFNVPYVSRRDLAHAVTGSRSAGTGQLLWHRILQHFSVYHDGLPHPILREASAYKVSDEIMNPLTDLLRRMGNKLAMSRDEVLRAGPEVSERFEQAEVSTESSESLEKTACEQRQVTGFLGRVAAASEPASPLSPDTIPPPDQVVALK